MNHRLGVLLGGLALAGALALAGCSGTPEETVMPPLDHTPSDGPPEYDPDVEPSRGVLALVPESATELWVTDYEQMKLHLGVPDLSGTDPQRERTRFWDQADRRTAMFSAGLLRDVSPRLEREFGWGRADVDWQAQFTTPNGDGWVIKIRDTLPMGDVTRAAEAGIGPLAKAEVFPESHLLAFNITEDGAQSWGSSEEIADLVGAPGTATYVTRECLPFDTVFGAGVQEDLAASPAADLEQLEELGAWSITFGGELVAARLGEARGDVFTRMRMVETLPDTDPEFGRAFRRGVADPAGGRLGWTMGDPQVAVELVETQQLPFAVCPE